MITDKSFKGTGLSFFSGVLMQYASSASMCKQQNPAHWENRHAGRCHVE